MTNTAVTNSLFTLIRGYAEDNGYSRDYVEAVVYGIASTKEELNIKKELYAQLKTA